MGIYFLHRESGGGVRQDGGGARCQTRLKTIARKMKVSPTPSDPFGATSPAPAVEE
jgi:hypothetical protein